MIRETAEGVTLSVRAQPGAKKTALAGIYGEGASAQLKIAVHAPPIEGRANDALIAFLADLLLLPRKSIILVSGETNRSKVFLLHGARTPEVRKALAGCIQESTANPPQNPN